MSMKHCLLLFAGLWLASNVNGQDEEPRIVVSPSSQCANQTTSLSWTCIAYAGQEATYQPTSIFWYDGSGEQLANNSLVTIYSNVVVIEGLVFIESTLEASSVYSHLSGESSCSVTNSRGQDRASWILMYDIQPPVIINIKPASQIANYTGTTRMTCLALVNQEVANDTTFTWWGEYGQITNNTDSDTSIYINRITSGDLLFVESVLEVCNVKYVHLGRLSCVAENRLGRDIANWTVEPPIKYPPPRISFAQSTVRVSYGGMVNASCNVSVGPTEAYTIDSPDVVWLDMDGLEITPIVNEINTYKITTTIENSVFVTLLLEISRFGHQQVGAYECVARSIFGRDRNTLTIQTYEILTSPELLTTPLNQTVDCRSRVTLTCTISAFPTPLVQWYFNGASVNGSLTDSVNILQIQGNAVGLNFTETYLDICDFNDDSIGYYWCSALNILGNYSSDPVWIDIDPLSAPPVSPPTKVTVDRTGNSEAMVSFEPNSLGQFDVSLYVANSSTTAPTLAEKFDSMQATVQQPMAIFSNLDTCTRYWVVITGRYCTHTGSTEPMLVELFASNPYKLNLTIGDKDGSCNSWIVKDTETKIADMEDGLLSPTSDCGYDIPCFEGSTWKCDDKDSMKVIFETSIIGYNQESVSQIAKCIDDWIATGKESGQTFALAGSNLTVVKFEETAPPNELLPVWVWVVIVVGVVLVVSCFVIVILVTVTFRQKRNKSKFKKRQFKNSDEDEQDDVNNSEYTVAIVDNPLYAENEGEIDDFFKTEFEGEEEQRENEVYTEDLTKTEI